MSDVNPETIQRLLGLELPPENDSGASTVRGYLTALLTTVWREDEGFSGKRPFGNSGWKYDLYVPMITAGLVSGSLDSDGYVERLDDRAADALVLAAIKAMGHSGVTDIPTVEVLAAAHTYTAACAGHHPVGEPCPGAKDGQA